MSLFLSSSRKTLNVMIILIVLDCVGTGLLWFGYTSMQSKKTQEGEIRSELAVENQKETKLKTLQRTLSLAEEDRKVLETYLFDPSGENQIRFISQIENLGISKTGALVAISSLEPTSGEPKSIHGELAISGTWAELYHTLALIESLPTRVMVSRFMVSRSTSSGGGGQISPDEWKGSLGFDLASLGTPPQQ